MRLFAVAIRAPFCQDCSKAGAAEVDVMQCVRAESNDINFPLEAVIFVLQRGCKSAVWLRENKNKSR